MKVIIELRHSFWDGWYLAYDNGMPVAVNNTDAAERFDVNSSTFAFALKGALQRGVTVVIHAAKD